MYKEMTYSDMLKVAKNVDDTATLELSDDGNWNIVIRTAISQSSTVEDSWAETEADIAYNTADDDGGTNKLDSWAKRNNEAHKPLKLIAELYNLHQASLQEFKDSYNQEIDKLGYDPRTCFMDDSMDTDTSNKLFTEHRTIMYALHETINPKYNELTTQLNQQYGY